MTTQVEINILYLCIFFLIDLDYKHLVDKQNIISRQSFSNFYQCIQNVTGPKWATENKAQNDKLS